MAPIILKTMESVIYPSTLNLTKLPHRTNLALFGLALFSSPLLYLGILFIFTLNTSQSVLANEVYAKGPPAHGHQAKHHYKYYPEKQVYYDTDRNLYFYLSNGRWISVISLPKIMRLNLGLGIPIDLDHDKPYNEHSVYKKKYPPSKKHKKEKEKHKFPFE